MPQTDLAPTDTHQEFSHAAPEEQFTQIMQALGKLFERITPWLLDFDIWIFGGLIAFSLLVMQPSFL